MTTTATSGSWRCKSVVGRVERDGSGFTFSSHLGHVPNGMNHNNDDFSGGGRQFDEHRWLVMRNLESCRIRKMTARLLRGRRCVR
ncbi:hypothetical protein F2Q69_00004520 [Brassica cretica]|uniref:Uncharacterized protein n=1 Tax=Brassica cretica TaxID=69181 RepID=A0A8S9P3G0_BRACR|nr:hypothetical protein F2Q69_00004520 [Brassica cretica]